MSIFLPQPFFDLELMLLRKLEKTGDPNDVGDDLVAVRRTAQLYKELIDLDSFVGSQLAQYESEIAQFAQNKDLKFFGAEKPEITK